MRQYCLERKDKDIKLYHLDFAICVMIHTYCIHADLDGLTRNGYGNP